MNLLAKRNALQEDLKRENKDLDLANVCMRAALDKLDEEINIRREAIEDSFKPTKKRIFNRMARTNEELDKVNAMIGSLTTFEVATLAPLLANIISEHENEKYTLQYITADIRKVDPDSWGYNIQDKRYYLSCIAPEIEKTSYVMQEIRYDSDRIFDFNNHFSVLSLSRIKNETENQTLALNGEVINCLVAKYPYLNDFINYIITDRCNEENINKDLLTLYNEYQTLQKEKSISRIRK